MLHDKKVQQGVYNDLSRAQKKMWSSTLLTKLMTHQPISEQDLQRKEYGNHFLLKI